MEVAVNTVAKVANMMEKQNVPNSAIFELIDGQLLNRSISIGIMLSKGDEFTDWQIMKEAQSVINDFKDKYFSKISNEDLKLIKERTRLTKAEANAVIERLKR